MSLTYSLWLWIRGPGRRIATVVAVRVLHQVRRNLTARRLLSFPHLLVLFWAVILLWGERWIFDSKVQDCDWRNWEKWPKGATPHHLVLVADPQLIDPHTYPGRSWPLSALAVAVTDSYLRRGYNALQGQLHPDSVFFLGDLFDGGREWKPRHGKFVDPKWGGERSGEEKKWVKSWHRRYGDDFWLREYRRFGDIFFDNWNAAGDAPGAWQRGRKLVASLPGNHDLGFGAQVQVSVRDRFNAYFGDGNRVDIVGNHTIVSVDTVSLSADTSEYNDSHDLRPIYEPANQFLDEVQSTKRKLAQEELSVWYGMDPNRDFRFKHHVEEMDKADTTRSPRDPGPGAADFPTILLTHVPLYRDPGTPCGPKREHWPPTKPPKGQTEPVTPDDRNAISVMAGYQYQNVLNEEDSVKLIKSIGNVIHVFSGDDHDYCEVVHSEAKENVREITVKSMSMAMGVPTPGFLMVSLYNPIDRDGKPIPGSHEETLQTHLCLLPNQIHTYMQYVSFGILTLVLLVVRAFLVPILHLAPFALAPEQRALVLPVFKDKVDPPVSGAAAAAARFRSSSNAGGRSSSSATHGGAARWAAKKGKRGGSGGSGGGGSRRWSWGDGKEGPRITLDEAYYDGGKAWKAAGRGGGRFALGEVGRELWTMTWRVAWMAVLFWVHLLR